MARYLAALDAHKPKRGRKRTAESIKARLDRIEDQLKQADPLNAVHLRQERTDLRNELASQQAKLDLSDLEDEFVRAAKGYSERKGISYGTWRESGVPAAVLKRAGIGRGA
ncbi:MAG: hypothetical protein HYX34_01005 [Actinobacteria bacterium]|nr:hypothetical protein [Actinomycetota bacterium]